MKREIKRGSIVRYIGNQPTAQGVEGEVIDFTSNGVPIVRWAIPIGLGVTGSYDREDLRLLRGYSKRFANTGRWCSS